MPSQAAAPLISAFVAQATERCSGASAGMFPSFGSPFSPADSEHVSTTDQPAAS
jgi:hypothetical protein